MKMIDPHVDVADFYRLNNWDSTDFYREESDAWATLSKMKAAGIDVVGLTLYFDESFLDTSYYDGVKSFYDFYQRLFSSGNGLYSITSGREFREKPADLVGYFFSIEGFECFRSPADFEEFYDLGVRSFGFTWSHDNLYACGRHTKRDTGLTSDGYTVIERMRKREKLIVDIAHLSEKSIADLEKKWSGMIVTTHGNVRSIHESVHNLTDNEISIIVERDGVVSLFPLTEDTGPNNTLDDLYRHVDYIASKWGIKYVGYCSDIYPLDEYPFLQNAQDILINRDWYRYLLTRMKSSEVEQIMWGNWARILSTL